MKKLLIVLTIIFASSLHAQSDNCTTCGWYADNVKVDTLKCYSFGTLQLVLPYDPSLSGYAQVRVNLYYKSDKNGSFCVKRISGSTLNTYKKGNKIVVTVFRKGEQWSDFQAKDGYEGTDGLQIKRLDMKYKFSFKSGKPVKDEYLVAEFIGCNVTGTEDTYDAACNCIKEKPVYDQTPLGSNYVLTLTNRTTGSKEIDLNEPCDIKGTKVDMNNIK